MIKVYKRCDKEKLSEHFDAIDFACPDGSPEIPVDDRLIALLEKLYEALGLSKIRVVRGYMTPSYARRIGRGSDVYHFDGRAADVIFLDFFGRIIPSDRILTVLKFMGHTGGADYVTSRCVHIDVGTRKP